MRNPKVVSKVSKTGDGKTEYHIDGEMTKERFEVLQKENDGFVMVLTNGGYRKRLNIRSLRWAE